MNDLVAQVSTFFTLPTWDVRVARDHNNHHQARQSKNVAAYAKITGKEWTFYIKRLRTCIGRPAEGVISDFAGSTAVAIVNEGAGNTLPAEDTEPSRIHVDVGPNKQVSRLHAEIYFESETSRWMMLVNGRNGLKVNGDHLVRRGTTIELYSGVVFEIGGVEMMFVLPEGQAPITIDQKYLRRAGLIAPDLNYVPQENMPPSGQFHAATNKAKALGQLQRGGQPILAPAPPDWRRPDTPAKQRIRGLMQASSPALGAAAGVGGGAIIMNSSDINYQDENFKHIKPAFTYGQLISQAIMSAENEMATLNDIYEYMKSHYAHFRRPEFFKGWQNSIRHNLSLNPGFEVKQRGPEDTGKGGYWCFVPKTRDQMRSDAWGPRSSRKSPPKRRSETRTPGGSPGARKTSGGAKGHQPGEAAGGSPTRKVKRSPKTSPNMRGIPNSNARDQTPERLQLPAPLADASNMYQARESSPTPRGRTQTEVRDAMLSDRPRSPVLSSSFAPEDNANLMTPAPVKRHPHLAPPSTAQRPSQHMPTSSPAPFWRFAELGTTPGLGSVSKMGTERGREGAREERGSRYDVSPLRGLGGDVPQSSSPVPQRRRSSEDEPRAGSVEKDTEEKEGEAEESDGEPSFDLTRGFMKISNYHQSTVAKAGRGGTGAASATGTKTPSKGAAASS